MLASIVPKHRSSFRLCLCRRYTWPKPSYASQEVRGSSGWIQRERNPYLYFRPRKAEACGHHAYHLVRVAVQIQRPADDAGIAGKPALPKTIADYANSIVARCVLAGTKSSPQDRRKTDHLE